MIRLLGMMIFLGLSSSATAAEFPTVVSTWQGDLQGHAGADNTVSWKGIPFAAPPVGNMRWKRPRLPGSWEGLRDASEYGIPCVQFDATGAVIGNEDCLYLNVWRPDTDETDLPVYFWIHGGGNIVGASSEPVFDGSKLANNANMIVVSTNYRLGPFGWFTNRNLRAVHRWDYLSDSGNYGTLDIVMALLWVAHNINAFGGDRHNVTVAGQSAGGINIWSLLFSRVAKHLFHRAIIQSGGPYFSTMAEADRSADRVIDELLNRDGLSREGMTNKQIARYMRSKTAAEIMSSYDYPEVLDTYGENAQFRQIFNDGLVVRVDETATGDVDWESSLLEGDYNVVPIIVGDNEEESKSFLMPLYGSMPDCDYQYLSEIQNPADWRLNWDWIVNTAAPLLRRHNPDVYAYRFRYGVYRYDPANDCKPDPTAFNAWMDLSQYPEPYTGPNFGLMLGCPHGAEIPLFFGNFLAGGMEQFIFHSGNYPGYENLSDAMMTYVAQFAYTGAPGVADGVLWESWSEAEGSKRVVLDANATDTLIEMVPW